MCKVFHAGKGITRGRLKGWALDSQLFGGKIAQFAQKKSRIQGPPLQSPPQYALARMKHFTHGARKFIGELIVIPAQ